MSETIYERIRRLRLAKGMTQSELAAKVGYSGKDMVSRVEAGKVDITRSRLMQFADALGVSSLFLFNGSESVEDIGKELPPISETDKLIEKYNMLDAEDKARIRERIDMLLESDKYKRVFTDKAI